MNKTAVIVTFLLSICTSILVYTLCNKVSTTTIDSISAIQSIQKVQDSIYSSQIYRLSVKYRHDSFQLVSMKLKVDSLLHKESTIKRIYNDKRNIITNLSTDEHISVLSKWLSQKDSIR